ncbi:hypothetical protein, partial [Rhizobium ruizarguesonis]|uniref:hypothetical protein n=1 Tax=Rhizobium ruizarguesonis TaxID=2081791 RepID=UPI001AED8FB2
RRGCGQRAAFQAGRYHWDAELAVEAAVEIAPTYAVLPFRTRPLSSQYEASPAVPAARAVGRAEHGWRPTPSAGRVDRFRPMNWNHEPAVLFTWKARKRR